MNFHCVPVTKLWAAEFFYEKGPRVFDDGEPFHIVSYRFSGKVQLFLDDRIEYTTDDTLTFMPMGHPYSNIVLEDTHCVLIHFNCDGDIGIHAPLILKAEDPTLGRLFMRLAKLYTPDSGCNFGSMAVFYQILDRISELTQNSESCRMRPARNYMEAHFTDSSFGIAQLAEYMNVSDSYLRREYRRCFGNSPHHDLIHLRISESMRLLCMGYPVSEIAKRCGFTSTSYFAQCFRKETGISPSEYRSSFRGF